jgi:drug/metabolite transporter (DMT)-like permease
VTVPAPGRSAVPALLLVTLAVLFWAGNALLGRALHETVPPVALAFWRWSGAALLLLPFAWRPLLRDRAHLLAGWPIVLVLSVLGVSLFNTLLYHAAHTTTATNIALMQTAMPAAIVVLDLLLFRNRPSGAGLAGVLLAMLGAAWVVLRGDPGSLLALDLVEGDLWMLVAMVAYALYSVLLPRRPPSGMLSFLLATFLVGSALLLPFFLWERAVVGPHPWTLPVVGAVAYVAVGPSILAYLFWNRGVEVVGAARTGLFICLLPVFTALLAIPLLGEHLGSHHLAGFALIAAGIFLFRDGKAAPDAHGGSSVRG